MLPSCVGPSLEHWVTYQGSYPQRNNQLVVAPYSVVGLMRPPHLHASVLTGLILGFVQTAEAGLMFVNTMVSHVQSSLNSGSGFWGQELR